MISPDLRLNLLCLDLEHRAAYLAFAEICAAVGARPVDVSRRAEKQSSRRKPPVRTVAEVMQHLFRPNSIDAGHFKQGAFAVHAALVRHTEKIASCIEEQSTHRNRAVGGIDAEVIEDVFRPRTAG